jgi:hypothetical protein
MGRLSNLSRNDDLLCDIRRKHREELPGDLG